MLQSQEGALRNVAHFLARVGHVVSELRYQLVRTRKEHDVVAKRLHEELQALAYTKPLLVGLRVHLLRKNCL